MDRPSWFYREYEILIPYRNYRIVGRGDLSMNCDPRVGNKKGYGYCIEREYLKNGVLTKDLFYFTEKEMDEYLLLLMVLFLVLLKGLIEIKK